MDFFLPLLTAFVLILAAALFLAYRFLKVNYALATQHLEELGRDVAKREQLLKKKTEEAEELSRNWLEKAKQEALDARRQVLKRAEEERSSILDQARRLASETILQGEKARRELIAEMDSRIELEALKKVPGFILESLSREERFLLHSGFIAEVLKSGLKALKKVALPPDTAQAQVISAFKLTEEEKKKITSLIEDVLKRKVGLTEKLEDGLIAGLIIKLDDFVVDATLSARVSETLKEKISN